MRVRAALIAALLVLLTAFSAPPAAAAETRGMWVWGGRALIADTAAQTALVEAAGPAGVTDLYLYLPAGAYRTERPKLRAFVRRMRANGIAVWGLDGCRYYFRDADGPSALFATVDAMIAYNAAVEPKARFVGFQTDNEPHDLDGYPPTLHNGKANSELSRTGGGVWQATEALDREMLLRDWIRTQRAVTKRLKRAGLKAGAAMIFYTEDYRGEPLSVTFEGRTTSVGRHLMRFLDEYVVMSYNTNPANAAGRLAAQAAYASTLPAGERPRVLGAVETVTGVGARVSFGDTRGLRSKAIVLKRMEAMAKRLRRHAAFGGISIHSWEGWRALPD